jgi:hypothetical protein
MLEASLTVGRAMTPRDVVDCLNTAKPGSLLRMLAEAMRATAQTPGDRGARVRGRALDLIADELRKLNSRLAKRPVVMRSLFTSNKPVRLFLWPQSRDREMRAIFEVINASDAGVLDRMKACEYCQRFFVARRDADRFCPGESCRKEWHRKTPEGKKHNAEHQRDRRKRESDRDKREAEVALKHRLSKTKPV